MKRNTKQLIPMILVFTIIAAAYSCRILAMLDIGGVWMNYIRAALYLLLFSLWGYSIDRRIIQKQALHCLRLTAALMLVWLILRTLKYEFVTDLTVARYIWYLYYLPMLFIPLLGVYIALTLGKSEEYRLTERAGFLVAVPGILFFAGDHQRSAPAGVCIQQRCAGRAGQLWLFPRHFLLLQHGLDGCVHDFFPCPPFEEKPRPQRQQKKDQAVCDSLYNGFVWAFVSVRSAGHTPVARGYECDILPFICGDL